MKTLRSWLRALTYTLFALLTLVTLFYMSVNWLGARYLHQAVQRIAGEGETLDFHKLLADPVPDSENFCAIPPLKNLAVDRRGEQSVQREVEARRARIKELAPPLAKLPKKDSATTRRPIDMQEWAKGIREQMGGSDTGDAARDILACLAKQEPLLAELLAAVERPFASGSRHGKQSLPSILRDRFAAWEFLNGAGADVAANASRAHAHCPV